MNEEEAVEYTEDFEEDEGQDERESRSSRLDISI